MSVVADGGDMQEMDGTAGTTFVGRMVGASLLRSEVYEEVEHDRDATLQAAIVVVAGSLAFGIGGGTSGGIVSLVGVTVTGLFGWAIYAWFTYMIGTRLLSGAETSADWGEVARTLGFANAPKVLYLLGLIPALIGLVSFAVGIWVLVTTIIALKAALDIGLGRSILIAVLGSIPSAILFAIVLSLVA